MSISAGWFTNNDDQKALVSAIVSVEPIVGTGTRSYYGVILSGGYRITVKESYYSRTSMIAAVGA